jgi:carboxymethylenebutenolidase
MKIIFVSLLSLVLSFLAPTRPQSQPDVTQIPLCHGEATDMAQFANDPAFLAKHDEPQPFVYQSAAGEMIKFNAPDGKVANGFLLKAKRPSNKWLLVYQEWWGMNDYIKQEAEKFYNDLDNVNVLAVDMYDGVVATKREDAAKLMQGADKARLTSIMKGAIGYAGPQAEIASVGWCFGGGLSLQSAMLAGKQAKGCVMYYGFPEMDVEKLKTLETDVLGLFASQDGFISPKVVGQFEENMKKAGEKIEVKMYEADHAFANPSNAKFDKALAEDAYKRSLSYLKARF